MTAWAPIGERDRQVRPIAKRKKIIGMDKQIGTGVAASGRPGIALAPALSGSRDADRSATIEFVINGNTIVTVLAKRRL